MTYLLLIWRFFGRIIRVFANYILSNKGLSCWKILQCYPANTGDWPCVGSMLGQHHRRCLTLNQHWVNILCLLGIPWNDVSLHQCTQTLFSELYDCLFVPGILLVFWIFSLNANNSKWTICERNRCQWCSHLQENCLIGQALSISYVQWGWLRGTTFNYL